MKKCPYCGQEIQDDAIKCRYCSESLVKEKKDALSVESLSFPKIWPGYLLAILFVLLDIIVYSAPKESKAALSLWGILLGLIGLVYWCMSVYKIHKTILVMTDNCYPISPARAVGFGFLPIYNIYWMFKWPSEVMNFINARNNNKDLKLWLPGLLLLFSAIASRIEGAIWLFIDFGVLAYIIGLLKKSLAIQPLPVPYKRQSTAMSGGAIAAIVLLCALPIIGLLAAIAIPNFIVARNVAQANVCVSNLQEIQTAKLAWAADTAASQNASPTWDDLVPKYLTKKPVCPKGGTYSIGTVASYPKCSVGDNNTPRESDDHILLPERRK